MFMCIYKKLDSIVVQIRNDDSVPQITTAQEFFNNFCNGVTNPSEYDFSEMEFQNVDFDKNKYLYSSETNTIIDNPNYVPPAPPPQVWNDESVRAGLTLTDKTRWDNNETQEIVTAKIEFQTPQERPYTTELLAYLVASNSISQTSMDRVLAE